LGSTLKRTHDSKRNEVWEEYQFVTLIIFGYLNRGFIHRQFFFVDDG